MTNCTLNVKQRCRNYTSTSCCLTRTNNQAKNKFVNKSFKTKMLLKTANLSLLLTQRPKISLLKVKLSIWQRLSQTLLRAQTLEFTALSTSLSSMRTCCLAKVLTWKTRKKRKFSKESKSYSKNALSSLSWNLLSRTLTHQELKMCSKPCTRNQKFKTSPSPQYRKRSLKTKRKSALFNLT